MIIYQAQDLRRLLKGYMEWGYALFPSLAFEDMLDRIQRLTAKAQVRRTLDELRDQERDRHLVRWWWWWWWW